MHLNTCLIHLKLRVFYVNIRVVKLQHKIFIAAFVKSFRTTKFFGITPKDRKVTARRKAMKEARDFVEERFLAQPPARNWRKELR